MDPRLAGKLAKIKNKKVIYILSTFGQSSDYNLGQNKRNN